MLHKTFAFDVKQADGDLRTFTISSRSMDREGDVLEPTGMLTANYLKNPVVLWSHDYTKLPIGKTTTIRATLDDRIEASMLFAPTDFAQQVRSLVDAGFLRASSVGFQPRASEPLDSGGRRYTSWELLEWSVVNVPSNPDAIAAAKSKGLRVDAIERAGQEMVVLPWWATRANLREFIRDITEEMIARLRGK